MDNVNYNLKKKNNRNNDVKKDNSRHNIRNNLFYKVEGFFDGIRKDNSRFIFTILLLIIIIDFIYDCML
jgi:hypothetical protein